MNIFSFLLQCELIHRSSPVFHKAVSTSKVQKFVKLKLLQKISIINCSFELSIHQMILKKKIVYVTVLNIDNNKTLKTRVMTAFCI